MSHSLIEIGLFWSIKTALIIKDQEQNQEDLSEKDQNWKSVAVWVFLRVYMCAFECTFTPICKSMEGLRMFSVYKLYISKAVKTLYYY